jgi:hypothetical protein
MNVTAEGYKEDAVRTYGKAKITLLRRLISRGWAG